MMKIGAIIQARTSSTRLPRKVLKELPYGSGITVLQQIIRRLKKSQHIDEIIVATSHRDDDEPIVQISQAEGVKIFRGSLQDVLERYYYAAKENELEVIIRITGDCPCVDPDIVDFVITRHIEESADYTSNVNIRSYADGFDVEVFNFTSIERAYYNAQKNYQREHVTTYIYEHPETFRIVNIEAPKELYAPEIRITLDKEQDYLLLCVIYDELYSSDNYFSACEIMKLFKEKPWLEIINKNEK